MWDVSICDGKRPFGRRKMGLSNKRGGMRRGKGMELRKAVGRGSGVGMERERYWRRF